MPANSRPRLCAAAIVVAAGTSLSTAQDELHWEDALSGNWSCFLCWDPNGPPLPSDAANISVPGTYTVTLDSNASVEGLTMDNPGATLLMSGRTLSVLATLEDHGVYVRAGVLDLRNGSSIVTPRLVSLQGPDAALLLQNSSSVTADVLGVSNGAQILAISGTSVIDADFLSLSGGGVIDVAASRTLRLLAREIDGGGAGVVRVNPSADLLVGDLLLQDATVEMAGGAEIRGIAGGNTLSVGPTTPAAVRGEGSIRDVGLDIGQNGVVEASTGRLAISGTHAGGFVNRGALRASSGVELHLGNSAVINTDGVIEALDGSIVTLSDQPLSITGGELRSEGSGVIRDTTTSGQVSLTDVSITGHYDLGSSGHTVLGGVVHLPGLITANSSTTLACEGGVLLHGGGDIVMAGSARLKGASTGATLTNNDLSIHGSGSVSIFAGVVNHGVISADDGGTLTLSESPITNRGTLRAEGGSTLILRDTAVDNTDGVIEALDGSVVTLVNQPLSIARGALRTEGSGVIRDATSSGSLSLTSVTIDGRYDLGSSGFTKLRGTITNLGLITLDGSGCVLEFDAGVILAGDGEIRLGHDSCDLRGDGLTATLVNQGNTIRGTGLIGNFGTLTNLGAIVADASEPLVIDPPDTGAVFDNHGELRAESAAGLDIRRGGFVTSGLVTVAQGALLQRSTSINSDFRQTDGMTAIEGELRLQPNNSFVLDGGVLTGSGTLAADLSANAGVVEPGSPVGRLVVDRDVSLGAGATLRVDAGASFNDDRLHVSLGATLAGSLELVAAPGDEPRPGQEFVVLVAGDVTGEFDDAAPVGFSANRALAVTYLPDRVVARIVRECLGDWTDDGTVNTLDLLGFLNTWSAGLPEADVNADGDVNTLDVLQFLNAWTAGC